MIAPERTRTYRYETKGTCSRAIRISVSDANLITDVEFEGGCDGNLRGIERLVKGMRVSEAITRLSGIPCGDNHTSCPDQLARALAELSSKRH